MAVLDQVLQQAQRRHQLNLAFEAISLAAAAFWASLVLLLLAGTAILDWYWPVAFAIAALCFGLGRSRKQLLSSYRLAQLVDRKLDLKDRLSTVIYFRETAASQGSAMAIVEQQAESLVTREDAKRAVPFLWSRTASWSLALAAVCLTLIGVRFGRLHSLDLTRPVAAFPLMTTTGDPESPVGKKPGLFSRSIIQQHFQHQLASMGLSQDEVDRRAGEMDKSGGEKPGDGDSSPSLPAPDAKGKALSAGKGSDEGAKTTEPSDPSGKSESQGPSEQEAGAQTAKGQNQQNSAPKNAKSQDQSEGGITDRVRDALANLMNKLKSESGQENQEGESQQSPAKAQEQSSRQSQASRNTQSEGKSQNEGQPGTEPQELKEGALEDAPGSQSRASNRPGDKSSGNDPKGGSGKQDGEKALREAQQAAAMGKISEIFGKRAAQITGDVTVEVTGSKQPLKTGYSQQQAQSSGYAAEVNRDEIPLMYQSYVQRYFEELRKAPVKSKAASPKPSGKVSLAPAGQKTPTP